MDDQAIIRLFLNRDQTAIKETARSYGTRLHRLAYGILKSNEDAEESVNDTYLKAWNTIPPQKPNFFFAYLAKICRFVSLEKLDWKHARKRKAQIVELSAEMESCIPAVHMEDTVESMELGRLLNQFLKSLPEEQRLIFMRRYWFSDSIREISARYHISESKTKTTLHRTRNKLKIFLESEDITL